MLHSDKRVNRQSSFKEPILLKEDEPKVEVQIEEDEKDQIVLEEDCEEGDDNNNLFGDFEESLAEQSKESEAFGERVTNDQPVININNSADHEMAKYRQAKKEKERKLKESKEGRDSKDKKNDEKNDI